MTTTRVEHLFQYPGMIALAIVFVVSAVEVTGLAIWLNLQNSGQLTLAISILFGFLLVEHIIAQLDHNRTLGTTGITKKEIGEIACFTLLESGLWAVWLLLIPINAIIAGIFFFITLLFEHQFTNNVKNKLPFFHISAPRSLVFVGLIIFTLAEFLGAILWLSQSLLVAMIIGSIVEHYIATNVGRLKENITINQVM